MLSFFVQVWLVTGEYHRWQ